MPTTRTPCNVLGKKHDWKERDEKYSSYSSQSEGKAWVCRVCGTQSDEKPSE